ncbi:MAG: hypothetical protein WAL22_13980 [Solirubrobacteraceae bacterium]
MDTVAEEIVDPRALRVFARSAFGYGHDADARAGWDVATFVAVASRRTWHVVVGLLLAEVLLLPHAAITRLAAPRTAITRRAVRRLKRVPILINS